MYKCKHYKIGELVAPSFLKEPEDVLWKKFSPNVLIMADFIRELYGPCFVNNSQLKGCGLRDESQQASASAPHRTGHALDIHIISIEQGSKDRGDEYHRVRTELVYDDGDLAKRAALQKKFVDTTGKSLDNPGRIFLQVLQSIYFEDKETKNGKIQYTTWLHIQDIPVKSGNRLFLA